MIGTRGMPTTFGGVERAVEELSARLATAGHDVTVYCRSPYCESRLPEYRGVRLRYLPAIDTKHLEAISHSLLATLDAIVRRYDVVHFHALGPSLCAPLARLAGLKVVTTVHALDFRREKWGRVARLALRLGAWSAIRVPHRTIVVSRQLQSYFEEEHGRTTTYVPNGVDAPDMVSDDRDARRLGNGHLLFLGRLVPEKGVHTLIEAYRMLETDVPLVIAGPGSHSEDYELRLHKLVTGDTRITLVGPVYGQEKSDLFEGAYAFCQPSTLEGLPIVLLEAMSRAICPVVSDIPEHLEVVSGDDGTRSAIVFHTNDPASLRDALETALADPAHTSALGAAARQIVVHRYDWNDVAKQVERLYMSVAR